jgi:hypothetical protein
MAHDFAAQKIRRVAWEYDRDGTWPQTIIEKAWEVGMRCVARRPSFLPEPIVKRRWHRLLHNGTARRPYRAIRLQPGGMITTVPLHFPTRLCGPVLHRMEDLGRLLLDASVAIGGSRRAIEFHRMAALQRTPRVPVAGCRVEVVS